MNVRVIWREKRGRYYPYIEYGSLRVAPVFARGRFDGFCWDGVLRDEATRVLIAGAIRAAAKAKGWDLPEDADTLRYQTWERFWRERAEVDRLVLGAEIDARQQIEDQRRARMTQEELNAEVDAVFERARRGS